MTIDDCTFPIAIFTMTPIEETGPFMDAVTAGYRCRRRRHRCRSNVLTILDFK